MKKGLLALILSLILVLSLAACSGSDSAASDYWLNFKPEIDETLHTLAAKYTEETGVEVKVVTAASGSYEITLTSEPVPRTATRSINALAATRANTGT